MLDSTVYSYKSSWNDLHESGSRWNEVFIVVGAETQIHWLFLHNTKHMCFPIKSFPHTLAASSLLLPAFSGNISCNCCVYRISFPYNIRYRPKLLCYAKISGCWASVGMLTSNCTQTKFPMYELSTYPPRVCVFSWRFSPQSKIEGIYKAHIVAQKKKERKVEKVCVGASTYSKRL